MNPDKPINLSGAEAQYAMRYLKRQAGGPTGRTSWPPSGLGVPRARGRQIEQYVDRLVVEIKT